MKIVALSDLHGHLQELPIPDCDVVTLSGDFSPLDIQRDHGAMMNWMEEIFLPWIKGLPCRRFIFCAGNHDFACSNYNFKEDYFEILKKVFGMESYKVVYLCNEEYLFEDKMFFGCPYSDIAFWAFSTTTGDPNAYKVIPPDLDVLLVHQPPLLGGLGKEIFSNGNVKEFGSTSLLEVLRDRQPKVVLCGHIHDGNHHKVTKEGMVLYNVAILDDRYEVHYKPKIIEI